MTLEVLVCTIDNGIDNIMNLLLTPTEGVSYLISWQHSHANENYTIPQELIRNDVKIAHIQGRGLSRNRNNAISHATGDICLIADDDCSYRPKYYKAVIDTFQKCPELDIATFKMKFCYDNKRYPQQPFNLNNLEKGYFVTSFEIAFRRTSVQGKLWFNEHFGLGAPVLQSGEENIFILDAIKAGMNCQYFPIVIVEHNHPTTTSSRAGNPGVIMAEGAYISIAYTWTALPRLILKAFRLNKKNSLGFFKNLSYIFKGVFYIKRNI
ncbi:MAG: glycosyltransferase [Muribaculaceae bacterium]|nr:glycosyltransferase [Muribaculaceae bacterium]